MGEEEVNELQYWATWVDKTIWRPEKNDRAQRILDSVEPVEVFDKSCLLVTLKLGPIYHICHCM